MIGSRVALWPVAFLAAWPLIGAQAGGRAGVCASCHPKQVSGYQRTGMANSLFRPHKQPSGRFTHAFSDTGFRMQSTASGMRQHIERNGFKAEYDVAYVIGSGNNAFGYLTQIGGYLFQSPISYYSKRALWGMAPGYERDREPDFTRPVTMECLLCHSGRPLPVGGTLNRYQPQPFAEEAISCDRCHGPSDAHVAKPSARNIVNPVKLPVRGRDSVCEQCHLGGEARIPNPGRQIADFRPGQDLEEIFSVYVFDTPAETAAGGLKVVSHVEQFALSLCARQSSGKMWCGTCHDPHDKPADPERYYRAKCLGCHTAPLSAPHRSAAKANSTLDARLLDTAPHPSAATSRGSIRVSALDTAPLSAAANCTGCHMPRRQTKDGGHTAFTDHRIARVPAPGSSTPRRKLVAWREPPAAIAGRNLGLANVLVGERDESAFQMDAGFRQLTGVYESRPDDAAVLTGLGQVSLRKGRATEAAHLYERAVTLEPNYAPYRINAATAWKEAGDIAKAISHLEMAIQMDPSLELAYRKLGEIYSRTNQPEKARQVFERYLRFMPGNVTARSAMDLQ